VATLAGAELGYSPFYGRRRSGGDSRFAQSQPRCLFTLKPDHFWSLLIGCDALSGAWQSHAQVTLGTGIQAVHLKQVLGSIEVDIPALIYGAVACPFPVRGQDRQGFAICWRLIRRIGQHAHAVKSATGQVPA